MPENTSKRGPFIHSLGLMSEGSSGYIEGMEAAGQRQMVAETETMPVDGPWDKLYALGFETPTPIEGDALFVRTRLPEGWSKQRTDHSMWSIVVDERGLERVAVFYKAAFYDRSAHFQVVNVGGKLANNIVYGDSAFVGLPDEWNVLTDGERSSFASMVDDYIRRAQEYPTVYGDRASRAKKLKFLLDDGSNGEDGEC